MEEIAKKKPEKNSGFDAFQKMIYLYNFVDSQCRFEIGPKKVILKHLTSHYHDNNKCISTAPIDSCMYNFMKTGTLSLN